MVERPSATSDNVYHGTHRASQDSSDALFNQFYNDKVKPRMAEASPRTPGRDGRSDYSPGETDLGWVKKLADQAPIDPKRPTAAFFDSFSNFADPSVPAKIDELPHGVPSAAAAEQHNYNVLRLERGPNDSGYPDFGKILTNIADSIDNGKLPLGKGDVLNLSWNNVLEFGSQNRPTYESANKILGMHLTPENLAKNIPEILKRMKQIADGHSPMSAEFAATMKQMLQANAAIDRIQKHGVEVVNSAGDGGPQQIDLTFLKAHTHLSGTDETGGRMWGSPQDSTDTSALSVYPIFYEGADPAHPAGSYRLGNTDVRLDANGFGGVPKDPHYYFKDAQKLYEPVPTSGNYPDVPKGPFSINKDPVGVAEGTSYANIDYLQRNYQRLLALKQQK
jgi:hypothetical protein